MAKVSGNFKAPNQPEFLVSEQEVIDSRRKKMNLERLMKYPRASLPELQVFILFLIKILDNMILGGTWPYSEEERIRVNFDIQCRKILEELVISVIIQNGNVTEVLESLEEKYQTTITCPQMLSDMIIDIEPLLEMPNFSFM